MMKKILYLVLFLPVCLFAQSDTDSAIIKHFSNEILLHGKGYEWLRQLTKNIGGRLAGSQQMVMAEQWGFNAMKQAGADTVFMQECKVPHWVRGGKDAAFIVMGNKRIPLNVLALGNSNGSGDKGVMANVIEVKNYDELDKRKEEVKGKIVFYNCDFDETNINTFESYGQSVKYRGGGAVHAARYGAVGVIVRSMTHSTDNNPHTGWMGYNDSFPKIPAVALGLKDVAVLHDYLQKNKQLEVKLFTYGKMLADTIGHNIVGEIKGTEYKDEYIAVGGHLDSWDVNEGANDDGAGVAQTLELLRGFKALNIYPKHTIRFVLFANEENGTRGADEYARAAVEHHEKHVFALESDAGGFTPRGFGITTDSVGWTKVDSWKKLLEPYGSSVFYHDGGGTDIHPLEKAFKISIAELIPDSQRYFDIHHSANDVFENVNKRELHLGAVNMAALIYLVDKYGL